MRLTTACVWATAIVVLAPSLAFAQATLAGTVRDSSGAVLPGVTVEASSPALIERTRSAVTDANEALRQAIADCRAENTPGEAGG